MDKVPSLPKNAGRTTAKMPVGAATWALALCALFISSDLLALRPGGFTLRPSDVLMVVVIMAALPNALGGLDFRWPVGFGLLLAWTGFVLIFVPNTSFVARSVGYAGWLLLDVVFVFAVVQIIDSPRKLNFVLRAFAISFGAIATFGLLQFVLPFAGINPPLVRQWWFPGVLARINGLSYEPSYFAGYMAMGWIFITTLYSRRSTLLSQKTLRILLILTTTVLIFCGSRSGWAIMLGWTAWKLFLILKKKPMLLGIVAILLVSLGVGAVYVARTQEKVARRFLSGTGLMGTSSYTISSRLQGFKDTLQVFERSPFVGVSLGGVIPAIGARQGELIVHQSETKSGVQQSQGTTAEALAATGLFGFPFYFLYMVGLVLKPWKLRLASPELHAAVNAFIAAMVVMQVQTNILQGYVWLSIALLSACYSLLQVSAVRARGKASATGLSVEGAA